MGVIAALALIVPFLFRANTVSLTSGSSEYLFTQFRMYPMYLRLMLAPVGLNADYDITPSQTLFEHFSWAGLLLLIAVFVGLLWCARKRPLIAFGGFLFFLALAPTSSIVAIADFAAERRLYIPAAGFFLAGVAAGPAQEGERRAISSTVSSSSASPSWFHQRLSQRWQEQKSTSVPSGKVNSI